MHATYALLGLTLTAVVLSSCGGDDGGDEAAVVLEGEECEKVSFAPEIGVGAFDVYDRYPLGQRGSPPGTLDSGGEKLGVVRCEEGITLDARYPDNPPANLKSDAESGLYRVASEGGGTSGWIEIDFINIGSLEESTRSALDALPVAADTGPLHPGMPPDLVLELIEPSEAGEECVNVGEVFTPSSTLIVSNHGKGSGPAEMQITVNGKTHAISLNRPLEPSEDVPQQAAGYFLDAGERATIDPADRVEESNEKNNTAMGLPSQQLKCVPG